MSWTLNVNKVPANELGAAVEALELGDGFSSDFARTEAEAQVAAAKKAALEIITSGAVVVHGVGEYDVSLNGHAEPGHERRAGYAGDTITVTVRRWYDYSAM